MRETVTFDDVLLEPRYSEILSRKDIDISNDLSFDIKLQMPVISAPMDTITTEHMANAMDAAGCLGILHRYNTIEEQVSMIQNLRGTKAAAIGVTGDFIERAQALFIAGVDILCLDIAHGHHILMKNGLTLLKGMFGDAVHIIAGNVATLKGFNDLADWGADSIKVGIGGGSICSTRIQTGHGIPTLQSVIDCSKSDREAKLIADGGIKNSGDIVKALAAGADFAMVGSLVAGTSEAPGSIITVDNRTYKNYRGMASVEAQVDWRGRSSSIEGVSHIIPHKGPVKKILDELETGIRSGFSYTGALNIVEFQSFARFIKQSSAGLSESKTHIKARYA